MGVCTRPTVVREEAAVARIERRHGARAVDAHQPVGSERLRAAWARPAICCSARRRVKAFADGLRRHALQPQALDRFAQGAMVAAFAARVLLDQAEDQFALAARVAGVDDLCHIFAPGLFDDGVQARLGLVHGLEVEIRRNHWQVGKAPLAAFDVVPLGRLISTRWPTALVTT